MGFKNLHHKTIGKHKVSTMVSDWKAAPNTDELKEALKPHGLHVYDGSSGNDDSVIHHISNKPMKRSEVKKHTKELYEGYND